MGGGTSSFPMINGSVERMRGISNFMAAIRHAFFSSALSTRVTVWCLCFCASPERMKMNIAGPFTARIPEPE